MLMWLSQYKILRSRQYPAPRYVPAAWLVWSESRNRTFLQSRNKPLGLDLPEGPLLPGEGGKDGGAKGLMSG